MSEQEGKAGEGDEQQAAKEPEAEPNEPGAALRQGLGLIWQAARTAAKDIKREVEKAGIREHVKAAGREIEQAATAAAKELEHFIQRGQPVPPGYSKDWPPPPAGAQPPTGAQPAAEPKPSAEPKPAAEARDEKPAEDGGIDPKTGERRDMRILLDDDDKR